MLIPSRASVLIMGIAIIIDMAAITTIPVRAETRRLLEPLKGNKTWDEFLRELAALKQLQIRKNLKELNKIIDVSKVKRVEKWAR